MDFKTWESVGTERSQRKSRLEIDTTVLLSDISEKLKKSIHPKLQNTNDLRVLNTPLHFIPLGHKTCKSMKTTSPLPLLKKNKEHL